MDKLALQKINNVSLIAGSIFGNLIRIANDNGVDLDTIPDEQVSEMRALSITQGQKIYAETTVKIAQEAAAKAAATA